MKHTTYNPNKKQTGLHIVPIMLCTTMLIIFELL